MVGLGVAASHEFDTIDEGDAWWAEVARGIEHETELPGVWGTGPVAFGSFTFDPDATRQRAVMIVPRVIIGRRGDVCWRTTLVPRSGEHGRDRAEVAPLSPPGRWEVAGSPAEEADWMRRVARTVARIADPATELEKVVLARSVTARTEHPIDPRWLVSALVSQYPTTWTFHVAGLVGASPELLIRRQGGLATSRVLAGTIQRRPDAPDTVLASTLAESAKDLAEHEYAVASVAEALRPFCSGMNVPDAPFVLHLPNVMHLASDVTGVVNGGVSSLRVAASLHPSAAVCGTPTPAARAEIAAVEGLDRGRYAGPVGWIDLDGDGEWAIALRCGQVDADDPRRIRLFAGCGIVAASDPASELAETKAKLQPMLAALGASE